VPTSVVKWSEDLSDKVSIIIRRYIDHMKIAVYMVVSFNHILSYSYGSVLYHCIYGCMFCMLLFNFVSYVFLLLCYVFLCLCVWLCMFHSGYSVSLCCSVYCLCVNVYFITVTVCQPNCG